MKLLIFLLLQFTQCYQGVNVNISNKSNFCKKKTYIVDLDKDCEKCKIEFARDIKTNIDSLTERQVYVFLCSMDESCINDVEFSQYSNDVLYLLLYKKPELVLKTLSKYDISLEYIREQLANPVNDRINVKEVHELIKNIDDYKEIKENLLKGIKLAIEKYN